MRLLAVMLAEMGAEVGGPDAPWRAAAHAWFTDQLARPDTFAAFVVVVAAPLGAGGPGTEEPGAAVVSAAAGVCDARAPGPRTHSGVRGHVLNVATEPAHRRRGHARACLTALLDWFSRDTAADVAELTATADGAGMYRSLGFRTHEHPSMRLDLRVGGTVR